ncbi:MAG: sodium-dependent transporter [Lentisphaeria bacterium]
MSMEVREELRENWGTRTGFILAAVGSAVGLGNLWGFPYKLYDHGGGAFLVPYILGLLLIGIPMMILEFSLGHRTQRAAPDAFGKLNRRFEIVGWWGILLGFVIICYYPVILAYCFTFLWESWKGILSNSGELPWAGQGLEGVASAKGFFYDQYLGYESGSFALDGIQRHIVIPLLIAWAVMYLCICTGVKLVGKIVWLTVPVPWIMLLILTVRGLTLPGADQGLAFYLDPDWTELAKPATWRFAFGQVFFSLSLAFGVMITYSSFLHRESDINNNAAIISLADLATSFIAGLAVFATLGGMAYATQAAGQPVAVENVIDGGPGLAFVAFPYALAQLPYSAVFSFIFFFALVTLGVDSAFSITESVLASIVDKTGWRRSIVLPCMSLIGLLLGLFFVNSGGGLNWLGTVDGFINGTWGIAFMGLLECVVLGWLFRISRLREHANVRSDWNIGPWWDIMVRIVIPAGLAVYVAWNLADDWGNSAGFIRTPEGDWILPNVVGMGIVILSAVGALALTLLPGVRPKEDEEQLEIVNPLSGAGAFICSALGGGVFIVAVPTVISALKGNHFDAATPQVISLTASGLGFLGLIVAQFCLNRDTTETTNPSWLTRWAGFLGTIEAGAGIGLLLALKSAALKAEEAAATGAKTTAAIDVTPEFGAATWYILTVIAAIMIIGFGWCFYRALAANNGNETTG